MTGGRCCPLMTWPARLPPLDAWWSNPGDNDYCPFRQPWTRGELTKMHTALEARAWPLPRRQWASRWGNSSLTSPEQDAENLALITELRQRLGRGADVPGASKPAPAPVSAPRYGLRDICLTCHNWVVEIDWPAAFGDWLDDLEERKGRRRPMQSRSSSWSPPRSSTSRTSMSRRRATPRRQLSSGSASPSGIRSGGSLTPTGKASRCDSSAGSLPTRPPWSWLCSRGTRAGSGMCFTTRSGPGPTG